MLKFPLLFSVSLLVALFSWANPAKAKGDPVGLSFALPPTTKVSVAPVPSALTSAVQIPTVKEIDLVRAKDSLPPLVETIPNAVEPVVVDQAVAEPNTQEIGLQFSEDSLQMPVEEAPAKPAGKQMASLLGDGAFQGLSFDGDWPLNTPLSTTASSATVAADNSEIVASIASEDAWAGLDDWIFEGGSRSLVAHTVGSAEGTRRWNGDRTQAYYGHVDPGNGVWNLGTFSYQHGAKSPEEADEKQIKRLKYQGFELEAQASQQGLKLSLPEKLNGLDLANQAPLAALGQGGYVERLAEAYRRNMRGEEAIAFARTKSYIDPNTQTWDAPGLGNNAYSISQDQERRMQAIDQALRAYEQTEGDRLALSGLEQISIESSGLDVASSRLDSGLDDVSFDKIADDFEISKADVATNAGSSGAAVEDSAEITFALPPSDVTPLAVVPSSEPAAIPEAASSPAGDSERVAEEVSSEPVSSEPVTTTDDNQKPRLAALKASVLKPIEPAAQQLLVESNSGWLRTEDKIVNQQ